MDIEYLLNDQKTISTRARVKIIQDLETTFQAALKDGNYASAIKALELQGKELGLFNEKNKIPAQRGITEFSTQELKVLVDLAPNTSEAPSPG